LPSWSNPLEVDRLADEAAEVDFAVPLAALPGLRTARAAIGGSMSGRVHFGRHGGAPVAELNMSGIATLECQRCMEPMQLHVNAVAKVALIGAESQAERAPADFEPVLAPGGRISVGELITEELLLSLPIVPLHSGSEACPALPASAARDANAAAGETHRPFERLAELMKR
jgi:uncharacterized protein